MFAIKRPTKTVDIVTDLDTLAQAVDLKQQIDDATPNTAGMTDAEICAANKTTDKGHALTEVEARRRILDKVIYSLEQRCGKESYDYRAYSAEERKVEKFLVYTKLFATNGEGYKGAENTYGYHHTVHVYDTKQYGIG